MPTSYNNIAYPEWKWDIPRIASNESGIQSGYAVSARLSPTGVNPANWCVFPANNTLVFVWGAWFSTDTAIELTAYYVNVDPGFTAATVKKFGIGGGNATSAVEAAVAAAAADAGDIGGGFMAANSYTDLLGKGWYVIDNNIGGLCFKTAAVAANCRLTLHWTEVGI